MTADERQQRFTDAWNVLDNGSSTVDQKLKAIIDVLICGIRLPDQPPAVPTPTEKLAFERSQAVGIIQADPQAFSKAQRAAALVTMEELNLLRQWIEAFKAAVAAATTLADLKSRVAALSAMPDRTATQIKGAIQNKINAGAAD